MQKPLVPTYKMAIRDALGFPAIMLLASMTGFGSLARESGFSLGMALITTAGIWGLPGQIALAELYATGTAAMFVILASSLANARFMPMAVSFMPLMREGIGKDRWLFVLVQLLSINSWVAGLRAFPQIDRRMRVHYYVLFATVCMIAGLTGTSIGYFGIEAMNRSAALGLLFLNPLFFAIMIAGTQLRPAIIAIMVGIPLGPVFHSLSSDWGLLAAGLVGGSAAFWIHRMTPVRSG